MVMLIALASMTDVSQNGAAQLLTMQQLIRILYGGWAQTK
jgi:hypothetical protein